MNLSIILGLATLHVGGHDYNNDNQLIALKLNDYVVGTMDNSHNRRSYILAKDYPYNDNFGVLFGGLSGYDYDCLLNECKQKDRGDDDILPLIAPYYQYKGLTVLLQGNAISIVYEFKLP